MVDAAVPDNWSSRFQIHARADELPVAPRTSKGFETGTTDFCLLTGNTHGRLTQKDYLSLPTRDFLHDLGGNSPTPGGGSAAALAGSIGVNLGHMVATFALKRAQKQGTEAEPIEHAMTRLQRRGRACFRA